MSRGLTESGALFCDKHKVQRSIWSCFLPAATDRQQHGSKNLRSDGAVEGTKANKSTVLGRRVVCQPSHA